ncbi:MAG: hypothetical protein ACM3QU_08340 [Verrucomicrobiota bacterium]
MVASPRPYGRAVSSAWRTSHSHSFRDFTLVLRITGGTGRYSHAGSLLSLTYSSVWTHTFVNGVYVDEIEDTGTLVGRPR